MTLHAWNVLAIVLTADYRKWDMGKPKKYGPEAAWQPPKDRFEGQSTFQRDYRRYNEAPRQPMRPNDAAVASDAPFDGTTGYREEYVRHPMGPKFVKVIIIFFNLFVESIHPPCVCGVCVCVCL